MKNWFFSFFLFIGISLFTYPSLDAALVFKNGKLIDAEEIATLSPEEHFALGSEAFQNEDWREAARQFRIVSRHFSSTSWGQESLYYLGVSQFYDREYDLANESLTAYLNSASNPELFQETIEYKFAIAEKFRNGAKRRFFGTKYLPKWASGKELAIQIYNEIIATMPTSETAVCSLMAKGRMAWQMEDFRSSVESFQTIIRRFPKHELTPECYLLIGKVYLSQCEAEFQNPDILAFAQINLKRFIQEFPRDERVQEVEKDLLAVKEIYASGLYETGRFYERTQQYNASILYYKNALSEFPDTAVARLCKQRLQLLTGEAIPDEENRSSEALASRIPDALVKGWVP